MAARVRVELDQSAMRKAARDLAYPMVDDLTQKVTSGARRLVRKKSGAVLAGITSRTVSDSNRRIAMEVQALHPRSLLEHQGAKRHVIEPRKPGGRLVFHWDKVGHRVSLPSVNHPGTKGSKFLTTPLLLYGGRMGFEVNVVSGYIPLE